MDVEDEVDHDNAIDVGKCSKNEVDVNIDDSVGWVLITVLVLYSV